MVFDGLGAINSEEYIILLYSLPQGFRVTVTVYTEMLGMVVKTWIERVIQGRLYMFKDSASFHMSQVIQEWLTENYDNVFPICDHLSLL